MDLVDLAANPIPAGAIVSMLDVGPVRLRVAHWVPPPDDTCRGTVVVLPGRGEFIEKYAEVVADLLARRFAAVVIDWRGQGGSSRLLPDRRRGHIRHFADYRADLDTVAERILHPHCPRPFFALAHSMGGAIVVDHAARGAPLFERIVLSAPMIDLYALRLPRVTRAIAASLASVGGGGLYIPGGSAVSWMSQPFAGNGLTADPARYAVCNALAKAAPDLLIGAPTLGWLHAAFRAMAALRQEAVLQRIATPVLAVTCGADRVVDTTATETLVARMKVGRTITIPHALHEILMERDVLRGQFWAAFDAFVPGSFP